MAVRALNNLGTLLSSRKRYRDAAQVYELALPLESNESGGSLLDNYVFVLQLLCDWDRADAPLRQLHRISLQRVQEREPNPVYPLNALLYDGFSAEEAMLVAAARARR
jgi:hypothetical protein